MSYVGVHRELISGQCDAAFKGSAFLYFILNLIIRQTNSIALFSLPLDAV